MSLINICRKGVIFLLLLVCLLCAAIQKPLQLSAQSSGNPNKWWASAYLGQAYKEWVRRYVRSNGMVYAADWSRTRPNSALTEGQSYAMTMSAYMNDPGTFARVWQWTRTHMQTRPHDKLFYWWTGTRSDGSYGPISNGNASDGDELIGYALIKAGERWNRSDYLQQGLQIARDIWNYDIIKSPYNGRYYVAMSTMGSPEWIYNLEVAPGYYMPYVYRTFAHYDSAHAAGWSKLYTDSYDTLSRCARLHPNNITPNYCNINIRTSVASRTRNPDFSSDAERIYWHLGLDASNGDYHARSFLQNHPFLTRYMSNYKVMPRIFKVSGVAVPLRYNDFADDMTMVTLAQMNILSPGYVKPYYDQYLLPRQRYFNGLWDPSTSYFCPAVAWFSLYALASG